MSTTDLTVIERLVILRRRLDLTVPQAAKRWRLHARTLASWEQGTRAPSAHNAERLDRIIGREWKEAA